MQSLNELLIEISVFLRPNPVPTGTIHIWELKSHHCRWIEGSVDGLNTLYCGAPRQRGSSYCSEHTRRAQR